MSAGWKRLALVTALFWLAGWSAFAWVGNTEVESAVAELNEYERTRPQTFTPNYFEVTQPYYERMYEGRKKIAAAKQIGIYVPLSLLVLSPFVWFVYRGFKPKRAKEVE